LAPMYYRGAAAAIVVYDISNQVSEMELVCMCL
jgi:GTPase SAR1 family protein